MMKSPYNVALQPDFRSTDFLIDHVHSILTFYYPQCIDQANGGYFQHFDADGKVSHTNTQRHLVSSSRLKINFDVAARQFADQDLLAAARHGIKYLRNVHRNKHTGG